MRITLKRWLVLLVALFATVSAHAEDTIALSGMTFRCSGCELRSERPCQAFLGSTRTLQTCAEARRTLLLAIPPKSYDGKYPTIADIRHFLLTEAVEEPEAGAALAILISTPSGERALIQDATSFVDRYSDSLTAIVQSGTLSTESLLALWKLPSREGVKIKAALRAAVAGRLPDLTGEDLFIDLSVTDLEHALGELREYETALQKNEKLRQEVQTAIQLLEACRTLHSCESVATPSTSEPVRKYLQRIQLRETLEAIKLKKLRGAQLLEALLHTPWKELRTPEMHALVVEALDDFVTLSLHERADFLATDHLAFFDRFAENDPVIAQRYAVALLTFAQGLWDAEHRAEALPLINHSLEIYPNEVAGRDRLLAEIGESEVWRSSSALQKANPAVAKIANAGRPLFGMTVGQLVGLTAIFIGLALCYTMGAVIVRQRRVLEQEAEAEEAARLAKDEEELVQVLRYFSLPAHATMADLVRHFRRLAKETHPDAPGGNEFEFKQLQAYYKRAQELLIRLRGFTAGQIDEEASDQ